MLQGRSSTTTPDAEIETNITDSHGASIIGFAFCVLLAGGVQPRHRVWSCEEILIDCAAFQARAGRAIRAMDFDDPANGLPSIKTLRRKIGNTTTLRLELERGPHQRAA